MRTVNIDAAKTHLSRLVDDAAGGEEIIIARAGRPVARLVPLEAASPRPRRQLGRLAGQITVPADFDAPHCFGYIASSEGALKRINIK